MIQQAQGVLTGKKKGTRNTRAGQGPPAVDLQRELVIRNENSRE